MKSPKNKFKYKLGEHCFKINLGAYQFLLLIFIDKIGSYIPSDINLMFCLKKKYGMEKLVDI